MWYNTETESSKGLRDLMALGCSVPSEVRELLKGQRVSKFRRTQSLKCLTDLEHTYSNS